jgi:hypothetical protein
MNSSTPEPAAWRSASIQGHAAPSIRQLHDGAGGASVIELESRPEDNALYRSFRALQRVGVDIIHAEVRSSSRGVIQRFYLTLHDGSALDERHLSDVFATLERTHFSNSTDERPQSDALRGAA